MLATEVKTDNLFDISVKSEPPSAFSRIKLTQECGSTEGLQDLR